MNQVAPGVVEFGNPGTPSTVPASVTMRQGREMLINLGLLAQVDAFIAAIPDPIQRAKAQNYWEWSNTIERDNPLVAGIGAALDMNAAQLDDLFIQAKAL